jgi:NAD(P)H-hydrate epimerase
MRLVTAAQMREIDHRTIEERGVPGSRLMELAGRQLALDVAEGFPGATVAVVCGKGNNGGDGAVAARYLHQAGHRVEILFVEEPRGGDARWAWDALPSGLPRRRFDALGDVARWLAEFDVVVDALLGTGTRLPPTRPYDELIRSINAAQVPVVSADIPTGLHPDTGLGELFVRAYRTVTFGLPKVGMVRGHGPDACGFIRVEPLEFPTDLLGSVGPGPETLTIAEARALLPSRSRDGHKGTFGRVMVAAGSAAMPGAAQLAAEGAIRSGAGLVELAAPAAVHAITAGRLPEVILGEPMGESEWRLTEGEKLRALMERADAMVVGPGLGLSAFAQASVMRLLALPERRLVIDADALTMLANEPALSRMLQPGDVLTPHPGEAARLLGSSAAVVQSDRWTAVQELAHKFGCVVVLKGSGTLVADGRGAICHIPSGNTALARGGAGDLLAGLIGGLLAQGLDGFAAARLGAFVHGVAADVAVRDGSPRGLRIADVAAALPLAWREIERAPMGSIRS